MSNRLDKEREAKLQPERIAFAIKQLNAAGVLNVQQDSTSVWFTFKNHMVKLYPYSGWFTGKSVKDGRGLSDLHSTNKMRKYGYSEKWKVVDLAGIPTLIHVTDDLTDKELIEFFRIAIEGENYEYAESLQAEANSRNFEIKIRK